MKKSIFSTSVLTACIILSIANTSIAAEVSKNIASGDYAFSNSSQSYGDNGYYDDPQGIIRAFDNDAYTAWQPAIKNDTWLGQAFPSPMLVKTYAIKGFIENFKLQGSHNGIAWMTLDKQTNQTDLNQGLKRFTIPSDNVGAYNYYRIYAIGKNHSAMIHTLEMYGKAIADNGELTDISSTNNAQSSSNAWVMTDEKFELLPNLHALAFDNIAGDSNFFFENTYWRPKSQQNEWIGQQFTSPKVINSYTVQPQSVYMAPEHWQLQASNDGINWQLLDEQSGVEFNAASDKRSYEISAEKRGAYQYYRLFFPYNIKPIAVSEVELLTGGYSTSPVPIDDSVMVVVRDAFGETSHYPQGSHGGFVTDVAKGYYNPELNVPTSVIFRTSNINDDQRDPYPINLSEDAFKADIINISSSVYDYTSALKALKNLNDYYPQQPLFITSAGNWNTTCTEEAAELGRTVGLTDSVLRKHFVGIDESEWEHFSVACDMNVVAAIDKGVDKNWIVVSGDFRWSGEENRPNRPLGILKYRGVAAPYTIDGRDGTSFSTPYISALAAMIKSRAPEMTYEEVADIIFKTADDVGEPGVDDIWGHGIANPDAAMAYMDELGY